MMSPYQRWFLAVALGLLSGAACYWLQSLPGRESDSVDVFWAIRAARDLMVGADPYNRPAHANSIPYPLPAALVLLPLAWLPRVLAGALFLGGSVGLLVYASTRDGHAWRLLLLLSPSFWFAVIAAQWSPLLLALAYAVPRSALNSALTPLLVVKPQIALPVLLSRSPNWRGIGLAAALGGLSLLIMPTWPWRWLAQIGSFAGFVPLFTLPLGPLLALSLLRWRDQRARLLSLFAAVPQYPLFYDQLLLFFVPQSPRGMALLVASGWPGLLLSAEWPALTPLWLVVSLYLPALVLVLAPLVRPRHPRDNAPLVH